MRSLTCERVSRLAPLFVENDLSVNVFRKVASHVEVCEACRRLVIEFRENGSLMSEACALPEFGGGFYDEIRHTVLEQIARGAESQNRLFGLRWIPATSLALALMTAAVAILSLRQAQEVPLHSVSNLPVETRTTLLTDLPPRPVGPSPRRSAITRRISARPEDLASRNEPIRTSSLFLERASTSEVSRIEIQTSNPNIRIIWLASSDNHSSRETDPDKNETGPRTKDLE